MANAMPRRDLGRRILALNTVEKARLIGRILADDRIPPAARAVLPGVFLYAASPVNLVSKSVPLIGRIDSLVVIAGGLALFLLLAPDDVVDELVAELE